MRPLGFVHQGPPQPGLALLPGSLSQESLPPVKGLQGPFPGLQCFPAPSPPRTHSRARSRLSLGAHPDFSDVLRVAPPAQLT